MARTRKPSDQRRQELMAAAGVLFAQRGYDATRVSDIVAAAGVSQATFFWHFPTKEHILVAMMEELVQQVLLLAAEVEEARLSAREKLLTLLRRTFDLIAPRVELAEVFRRRLASEELARVESQAHKRLVDALAAMIADGVAKGEIEAPEPDMTALLLFQMIHGAAEAAILFGEANKRVALQRVLAASEHLIAKALAPQPALQWSESA